MMKSDFTHITLSKPWERSHPAWDAFKEEMDGCGYGFDELNQAWHFFKSGWEACRLEARRALTDAPKECVYCSSGRPHLYCSPTEAEPMAGDW